MEETRLDLNKLCMDNEDPMLNEEVRCSHGVLLPLKTSWSDNNPGRRYWSCPYYGSKKCKFFRWRDLSKVDERSKYIIPKLVNKMKEMHGELASKEKKIKEMEEGCGSSEIAEMLKEIEMEEQSVSSDIKMKEMEEQSSVINLGEIENAKDIKSKKKGINNFSSNLIFTFCILFCFASWISWLMRGNASTCHDQLP